MHGRSRRTRRLYCPLISRGEYPSVIRIDANNIAIRKLAGRTSVRLKRLDDGGQRASAIYAYTDGMLFSPFSVRPQIVVTRGCGGVPAVGREGIRSADDRHGWVSNERQGLVPPDEVRPRGEMSERRRRSTQCAQHVGARLQPAAEMHAAQPGHADQADRVSSEPALSPANTDLDGISVRTESCLSHVGQLGYAVAGTICGQPSRLAWSRGRQPDAGLQERLGRGQSASERQQQPAGDADRLDGAETQRG